MTTTPRLPRRTPWLAVIAAGAVASLGAVFAVTWIARTPARSGEPPRAVAPSSAADPEKSGPSTAVSVGAADAASTPPLASAAGAQVDINTAAAPVTIDGENSRSVPKARPAPAAPTPRAADVLPDPPKQDPPAQSPPKQAPQDAGSHRLFGTEN